MCAVTPIYFTFRTSKNKIFFKMSPELIVYKIN